ncbi:MAG: GNAT family N-acetyltransferase [Oscillatoria sp. SIO1A7]|nr:GNAT family N-acetyltransferase [Oscillatoria sp. SIO1A7]
MPIFTENIAIRRYEPGDAEKLWPILSDPITMSFWPVALTRQMVENWLERSLESYDRYGFGRYAVALQKTGELVGDAGIIRAIVAGEEVNDLGYIIHHPYWRRGYATEAVSAIKDYAFTTLGLAKLHANMPWNHHGSRRVAEKIGMQFIREFENERNRNIRTFLYAIARPATGALE